MGRKALVDYSFIKEICDNLRSTKTKFRGQLDLEPENGPPKEGKKVKEVRRLLVSRANEKTSKGQKPKKRKRIQSAPERFTQNSPKRQNSSSESSSDTASSCGESCSDDIESDDQAEDLINGESDTSADDNGEAQ